VVSFESDPGEYVSQESKNTRAIPHGSGRIVGPEVFKISSSEGITAISPYFHECIEYAYISFHRPDSSAEAYGRQTNLDRIPKVFARCSYLKT